MLFDSENSVLIIIDVQGKLALKMSDKELLFSSIAALIKTAKELDIPILVTEQVPNKLGETIPQITKHLSSQKPISKNTFSCWKEPQFQDQIKKINRSQIIISGIESHICVMQTVVDLLEQNYTVQVVADAVSSRKAFDKSMAIERMRQKGADITTVEMLLTELLGSAAHPKFKEILQLIR